jgi:hypothetical protein
VVLTSIWSEDLKSQRSLDCSWLFCELQYTRMRCIFSKYSFPKIRKREDRVFQFFISCLTHYPLFTQNSSIDPHSFFPQLNLLRNCVYPFRPFNFFYLEPLTYLTNWSREGYILFVYLSTLQTNCISISINWIASTCSVIRNQILYSRSLTL